MIGVIIILAIVQGLTEFLPVSSSGHLVLLNKFFRIQNDFLLLSVILHVATLFSVVWVLRDEVIQILKKPFGPTGKKLIFATIPTIIIVLVFKGIVDKSFDGAFLPFCFMLTAVLIVVSEILNKKNSSKDKQITKKTAIIMGIAQGIAVLPGISRSGATICSGLMLGKDRKEVAHFSFLMSIPIICASLIFEVYEYIVAGQALTLLWYEILIGFVVALITGVIAVKFMLKLIEKHSLIWFSVYLAIISVVSFFVI